MILKLIVLCAFIFLVISLSFIFGCKLKAYFIKMLILENYYRFSDPQSLYDTYFENQVSVFKFRRVLDSLDSVPDCWKNV